MAKRADLSPPLGFPGGPCHVVDRIEDNVRSPLQDALSRKVERGEKLTNPEAAKIYSVDTEPGSGVFRSIKISPHAQYRMDQRGVTVGDLRVALRNYSKKLNDWKSRGSWEWEAFERATLRRETIEWVDKRIGNLEVVFVNERGTAVIVTTYWKDQPDPPPEACKIPVKRSSLVKELDFGVQTFVSNPKPNKSETGEDGGYSRQSLPSPPHGKVRPGLQPAYNTPSRDDSGESISDRPRTKGVPGGQGGKTHPTPEVTDNPNYVTRRAGYTPQYPSHHPPANKRQRTQKGQAKRYFSKRYRKQKGKVKRRQKIRYNRLKHNNRFLVRRDKSREAPEKHKRKPGGPSTIKERSKRERAGKKAFAWESSVGRVALRYSVSGLLGNRFGNERDGSRGVESRAVRFGPVTASFFMEKRPPEMAPDTTFNRAKKREQDSGSPWGGDWVDVDVGESNPGSRVLPNSSKGHVGKQAALISDIRQGCSEDLQSKSRDIAVKLARVDSKNTMWLFDVAGSKEQYRVKLKAARSGNVKDLGKLHVKVSCSCPFWQWQGPEHWAKQGDYLFGKPVGTASKPSKKDPRGEHRACKHVLAVLDHVVSNDWSLASQRKLASLIYVSCGYPHSKEVK